MADSSPNVGDPFDLERIRQLVELMEQHDLSEVDLRSGDVRVSVSRGGQIVQQVVGHAAPPAVHSPPPTTDTPSTPPAADEGKLITIKSPVVGTFFASAKPGEPAFVKPGDQVEPDTVVCIVEAMKVFNEIPAGVSGKVVRALVQNEQAVEYNQALFAVEPS